MRICKGKNINAKYKDYINDYILILTFFLVILKFSSMIHVHLIQARRYF